MPLKRVAVIGPGRLGTLVAVGLRRAGYRIAAVAGGTDMSRQMFADTLGGVHTYANVADAVASAELVVLAVPDRALEPLVRELALADVFGGAHQVVHLSGSYGSDILALAAHAGAQVAACHPALSVPQIVTDPDVLVNAAWAVTADPADQAFAIALVEDLGGNPFVVAEDRRVLYHAALTLASNATAAALVTARRLLHAAGVDTPEMFLTDLAIASVRHAVRDGVAGVSGPVVRGDLGTLQRHKDAIRLDVADVAPAYDAFTAATVQTVVAANPGVDAALLLAHVGAPVRPTQPQIVTTRSELFALLGPFKRAAQKVVLVPTMGALHDGHLALVRQARRHGDVVVVSIFVNPTQFDNPAYLDAYPRTVDEDVQKLAGLGPDAPSFVFIPDGNEVYPSGAPRTSVTVAGLTDTLCGAHRPGHFAGVATVVTKLFSLTGCDVALFGQKDFQQTAVIRQLVHDLNLPVSVIVAPTVRDADGLALSSRNVRLSASARSQALALPRALAVAATTARSHRDGVPVDVCLSAAKAVLDASAVALDYLSAVDPVTLEPVTGSQKRVLLAVAGHVGAVRLIDNVVLGDTSDENRLIEAVFGDSQQRGT